MAEFELSAEDKARLDADFAASWGQVLPNQGYKGPGYRTDGEDDDDSSDASGGVRVRRKRQIDIEESTGAQGAGDGDRGASNRDSTSAARVSEDGRTVPFKSQKTLLREAMNAAPSITVTKHGGATVFDDGHETVAVVPPRIDRSASYGCANRIGEAGIARVGHTHKTWTDKTPERRHEYDVLTIKRIREIEARPDVCLSSFVVKLGLIALGRSREDAMRIVDQAKGPSARCEHLRMLPPYEAFSGPIRKELYAPRDTRERGLPQMLLSIAYVRSRESLAFPCIDGLEELREPTNGLPFESERIFNIRSSFTRKTPTLWVKISALDVHTFNTLHDDLVDLSGVAHMLKREMAPFSNHFHFSSLLGSGGTLHFTEESCVEWASVPIASEEDAALMNDFVELVARQKLPPREMLFPGHGQWNPERAGRISRAAFIGLLRQLEGVAQALKALSEMPSDTMTRLSHRASAFLSGYADWRYFCLPDVVAGCLALDYEIAHPEADETSIITCPANERCETYRISKVCRGTSVSDPALLMLFPGYSVSYDHYATSLMFYNLICGKKDYFVQRRRDESSSKRFYRRFRLDIIPSKAARHCCEQRVVGERANPATDLFSELARHVKAHCYDVVYGWRRYQNLCYKSAGCGGVDIDTSAAQDDLMPATATADTPTERILLSIAGVTTPAVYHPPKTLDKEEFPDERTKALAIAKAHSRNTVVFFIPRDRVVADVARLKVLDAAVALFDACFKLVPTKEAKSTKGHKSLYYSTAVATRVIMTYMKTFDMIKDDSNITVTDMQNYIVGQRKEGNRIVKYSAKGRLLVYNPVRDSVIFNWMHNDAPDLAAVVGRPPVEEGERATRKQKRKHS